MPPTKRKNNNLQSYTCENCFNPMHMTWKEYTEQALKGLVVCATCQTFARKKDQRAVPIPRRFTRENIR